MLDRKSTFCIRCKEWMRLRSVENVSRPEKVSFVQVYECRVCGRLAAEETQIEPGVARQA